MVTTANATGSSLMIKGGLDTSMIESGFSRIRSGFQGVKGQANSFKSDMERMSSVAGDVARKMKFLAVAGVGAMVGLATKAPAVAPALARMKLNMDILSRSLGQALAPAFERAGIWFERFVGWVDRNQDTIRLFSGYVMDFAGNIANFLTPALTKVGEWVGNHPKLFAGVFTGLALSTPILLGISAIKGLAGLVISSSVLKVLGWLTAGALSVTGITAVAGLAGGHITERVAGHLGLPVNQAGWGGAVSRIGSNLLGGTLAGGALGATIGALGGPIGAGAGALIGGGAGLLYSGGRELYQYMTGTGVYSDPIRTINEQDRRYFLMNNNSQYFR